jgi:sporulation protein YlmC with PRC-barrel domain
LRGWVEPQRLVDALVIDSEGYIVGFVERVFSTNGKLQMSIYFPVEVEEREPDMEKLVALLIEDLKTMRSREHRLSLKRERSDNIKGKIKKASKLAFYSISERIISTKQLYDEIKRKLGVTHVTQEVILAYARDRKIEIPYIVKRKKVRELRESVSWKEVKAIGESDQGVCVLLSIPLEARRRNITFPAKPVFKEDVVGKLVIDSNGKRIGYVSSVLYSVEGPGLRLSKHVRREEKLNVEEIVERARRKGIIPYYSNTSDLYKRVARDLGVKGIPSIGEVLSWAKDKGLLGIEERVIEFKFVVPWKYVEKCGDAILLRVPIGELVRKG